MSYISDAAYGQLGKTVDSRLYSDLPTTGTVGADSTEPLAYGTLSRTVDSRLYSDMPAPDIPIYNMSPVTQGGLSGIVNCDYNSDPQTESSVSFF